MFKVIPFSELGFDVKDSFYSARKETFHDRLGWNVEIKNNQEFDEFDNHHAVYLLGVKKGKVFSGVRFCFFNTSNMLDGPFSRYFSTIIHHSHDVIEASRFFVDKDFVKREFSSDVSITRMFFLSMYCFCRDREINKIIAVVSRAMLRIVRQHGWQYEVLEESVTESQDKIYLISMMVTGLSCIRLLESSEIKKTDPFDRLIISD